MAWPADFPPVEGFEWNKRENVRALVTAVAERAYVPSGTGWPPEWADPAADVDWNLQRAYWAFWDPLADGGAGAWTDPDDYITPYSAEHFFEASTVNWRLLQYQLHAAVSKGYVEAKDWSGYTGASIPTLTWYDVCVLAGLYRRVFATTCTGVYDGDTYTILTFPPGWEQVSGGDYWQADFPIWIDGYGGKHTLYRSEVSGDWYVEGDCSGVDMDCALEQYGFRRAIVEPPPGATIDHPAFIMFPHNSYTTHAIGAMRPQHLLSRVDDLDPDTWYCTTPGDPDPSDIIGLWIFQDIYAVCNVLIHTKHTASWGSDDDNHHDGSVAPFADDAATAEAAAEAVWDGKVADAQGGGPTAQAHALYDYASLHYGATLNNRWQEYQTETDAIWAARTVDAHWYAIAAKLSAGPDPPDKNVFGNSKGLLEGQWSKWLTDLAASREGDGTIHSSESQGYADVKPTWPDLTGWPPAWQAPWTQAVDILGYAVTGQTCILNWAREGGFEYY